MCVCVCLGGILLLKYISHYNQFSASKMTLKGEISIQDINVNVCIFDIRYSIRYILLITLSVSILQNTPLNPVLYLSSSKQSE